MTWVKLTSGFPMHRKIRPLSDAAFRLCVSAMCYSAENGTDGHILVGDLALVSDVKKPERAAQELVNRGLWESDDIGWHIHDYLDYNLSVAQGIALSEAKSRAGRISANKRRTRVEQEIKQALRQVN